MRKLTRVYRGSLNDARLDAMVARFSANAVDLQPYETSGMHDPLATLHTIADPIVPIGQETLYAAKAPANNSSAISRNTVAGLWSLQRHKSRGFCRVVAHASHSGGLAFY